MTQGIARARSSRPSVVGVRENDEEEADREVVIIARKYE